MLAQPIKSVRPTAGNNEARSQEPRETPSQPIRGRPVQLTAIRIKAVTRVPKRNCCVSGSPMPTVSSSLVSQVIYRIPQDHQCAADAFCAPICSGVIVPWRRPNCPMTKLPIAASSSSE